MYCVKKCVFLCSCNYGFDIDAIFDINHSGSIKLNWEKFFIDFYLRTLDIRTTFLTHLAWENSSLSHSFSLPHSF